MKHQEENKDDDRLRDAVNGTGISNSNGMPYHQSGYGESALSDGVRDDEEGIDLLKIIRIPLRRWLMVSIFLMIGISGAMYYADKATPIFKAEAELEMSVRRPRVSNNRAVYEDAPSARDADTVINTRFEKFRSPAMEEMAYAEYKKRFPVAEILKTDVEEIVRYEVLWTKERKSNIVRVSLESSDPVFASRFVNVLTDCSGALMIQENQSLSEGAVEWLHSQVEERRDSLNKVETQLSVLRKTVQLDLMNQRKVALGQALIEVYSARSSVENEFEARKASYEFVLELIQEDQDFRKLPSGLPREEEFRVLVSEWREASDAFAQVVGIYTDEHAEYLRLEKTVARSRQQVERFVDDSAASVKNELRLLELQKSQLNRRIAAMEEQSVELEQSIVEGEQKLQGLERRREAADDTYKSVLKRMEEARLSADENTAFIKVIRRAGVPDLPVRPRKLILLMMGAFLGIGFGCISALIVEFLSDKVVEVNDLRDVGLNVLGTIPIQKKTKSREDLATMGLKDKFSHIFEVFCALDVLISSNRNKNRTRAVLVGSVTQGEGKTICACNLAVSAAANGAKTLLIDGDMRRPRLATIFGVGEEQPSLLEWLSSIEDVADMQHLVSSAGQENLDVITSRSLNGVNPSELVGCSKLKELINWARQNYDRVIIDSPPLGVMGDALSLSNLVDSVVLVSRRKKTKKRMLKLVLNQLDELDATVLGCIYNGVSHSLTGSFLGGEDGYMYGEQGYRKYMQGNEDVA